MGPGAEEGARVGEFDDAARVHDRDPVGDALGGGQVVRDHQQGVAVVHVAAQFVDRAVHQVAVQAGGRFVGEQQRGVADQRERGRGALGQPAGQFVRVAVEMVKGNSARWDACSAALRRAVRPRTPVRRATVSSMCERMVRTG